MWWLMACLHTPDSPTSWLEGCWVGPLGEGEFEECWSVEDGVLVGTGTQRAGEEVLTEERLRIEQGDDGLVYVASPKGQAPTRFPATSVEQDHLRFENPEHDFPQSLDYRLSGTTLTVEVRGEGGGFDLVLEKK